VAPVSRPGSAVPRAELGFSLVELLVAMLLLSLLLAIAAPLLVEAGRIFASAGRALTAADDAAPLRQLRADLRGAVPAGAWSPDWTSEPLVLRAGERTIAWAAEASRLARAEVAEPGAEPAERVQLDGVVSFRWRVPFPGLVEVELVRRRPERAPLARVLSAQWQPRGETLEAALLTVAARRVWW